MSNLEDIRKLLENLSVQRNTIINTLNSQQKLLENIVNQVELGKISQLSILEKPKINQPQQIASNIIYTYQTKDKIYSKEQTIDSYIADQARDAQFNDVIPKKSGKIIRIMTYNVHYWRDPRDKRNIFKEIMSVIRKINPDILILQEVSFVTLSEQELSKALNSLEFQDNNVKFCEASRIFGGFFGNLIASKYPIVSAKGIKLTDPKEGRCAISCTINLPNNTNIKVYGIHLDVFDATERVRNTEMQEILNDVKNSPYPVILAGDFNSIKRSNYADDEWNVIAYQYQRLGIPLRTDITDVLKSTHWNTSFEKAGSTQPKYTSWSGRTIDYIYLSPNWNIPVVGSYVYHDAASDHLPVIMDLEI